MIQKKYSLAKMLKEIKDDEILEGLGKKDGMVSQDDIAKLIKLRKKGKPEDDKKS